MEKTKEENAALNQKVQELSSVDTSKKKLETKVQQLESRMEDMITEKVSQKENEMHATYDEKLRNYEDRCVYITIVHFRTIHAKKFISLQGKRILSDNCLYLRHNYVTCVRLTKAIRPSFSTNLNAKVNWVH